MSLKDMKPLRGYMGDGVYAEFDGYRIRLYLDNGINQYNEIFLEAEVCDALSNFMSNMVQEFFAQNSVDGKPAERN